MDAVSHRGPGSVAASEGSRLSRASSRSRTSASAREPPRPGAGNVEADPDALEGPTPLAPWRRHAGGEDTGDSSLAAEAALEELADRAAAATLAEVSQRAPSGRPWRRTRSKSRRRTRGPYASAAGYGSNPEEEEFVEDAQPQISPTQAMPPGRQPPSSQAFLLDPHASLGTPSSGEMRIQAALERGPPTVLDEPPPTAAASQVPAPYNNSLESRFDLMENKFLGILTTGFGSIREEQARQQAQMNKLTDMLITESTERRQQGHDLWARIEGRGQPHEGPARFDVAKHDVESSAAEEEDGTGATPVNIGCESSTGRGASTAHEKPAPTTPVLARGSVRATAAATPEKPSRPQRHEEQKRQRQWEAVEVSDDPWAAAWKQKKKAEYIEITDAQSEEEEE